MTGTNKRLGGDVSTVRNATLVVLVSVLLVGVVTMPAVAMADEQPETQEEFLLTFESMEGTEAFESYSEFELIRSQAIQDVQVGTEAEIERMELLLELLETFESAYQAHQAESYQEALDIADETRAISDQLRETERSEQYVLLADIALDRFYEQTAQTLLELAEGADHTPERIELLSRTAVAYDQAGATERFAEVELRADETEQRFETDVEQLNASAATLDGFLTDCDSCGSVEEAVTENPLSVFSLYSDSQSALSAGDEAIALAGQHGLDERESALEDAHGTADEYNGTLMYASVSVIMGYSVVLGLLVAVLTWRLMLWKRDVVDAQRGDVVLMGEMLSA